MLDFIEEALRGYVECHEIQRQTTVGGEGLRVLADIDGEVQWYYITAVECR